MKIFIFIYLLILFLFLLSCRTKTAKTKTVETFSGQLEGLLKGATGNVDSGNGGFHDYLSNTYQQNNYHALWLEDNLHPNNSVLPYLKELAEVEWDGLNPKQYHLEELNKLYQLILIKKDSLNLAIRFDTLMTLSYLNIGHDLLLGTLIPENVDETWFQSNDSGWNAQQLLLQMKSKYASLNSFRSDLPVYELMRTGLKYFNTLLSDSVLYNEMSKIDSYLIHRDSLKMNIKDSIRLDKETKNICLRIISKKVPFLFETDTAFKNVQNAINEGNINTDSLNDFTKKVIKRLVLGYQYYFNINPSGQFDVNTLKSIVYPVDSLVKKVKINMERCRWMKQQVGKLYVFVNIPLMELFFINNDTIAMQFRTVVGKPARPTPSLNALMNYVEINPTWGVPPTILKQDVLPGLIKSGKRYFQKTGLKAYTNKGKLVDLKTINAHNYNRYVYRQEAGEKNSLGYVKFNLRNPFDIYLHDTPHRGDFVRNYRALSSGCVRLQQPKEMTLYILNNLEHLNWDMEKLDDKISRHKTEYDILKTKIPVYITYLTVFEDSTGKHLRFANDVYGKDKWVGGSIQ